MLTEQPVIGQNYELPCVFGKPGFFSGVRSSLSEDWYPVFTPAHQDSAFMPSIHCRNKKYGRSFNKETQKWELRYDPEMEKHFHIDPRFVHNLELLVQLPHPPRNISYQAVIFSQKGTSIETRTFTCERLIDFSCSVQFKQASMFGQIFEDTYKDRKLKCLKCPHKGTDLRSIPPDENGIITCPNHGLRIELKTLTCIGAL